MFCPKCAAKNPGDVAFCRGCGEDISLVVRSLKGHTPLILASKMDQYFDRPNERMLRDSFILFLTGAVSSLFTVWEIMSGNINQSFPIFIWIIFIVYGFGGGIWTSLAYRHSLALKSDNQEGDSLQTDFFCPICGSPNKDYVNCCTNCGKSLEKVIKAIKKEPKGWFTKNLEKTIGKYTQERSFFNIITSTILGIFFIIMGLTENSPAASFYGYMMAVIFIVPGIWDFIVEKRRKTASDIIETPSNAEINQLKTKTQRQLIPINAENEINQFKEAETLRELHKLKNRESETKKLDEGD